MSPVLNAVDKRIYRLTGSRGKTMVFSGKFEAPLTTA
jgi:hypothetical protein